MSVVWSYLIVLGILAACGGALAFFNRVIERDQDQPPRKKPDPPSAP